MKTFGALLASIALFASAAVRAAEISILAPPAVREAMTAVAPGFERQSGYRIVFDYREGDLGAIAAKDERIDAVIAPTAQIGQLARAYRILPDTRRTLGRSAPTAEFPEGVVLVIAALKGGDREEAARSLCAYLTLPETIAALRRAGLGAP